MNLNESFFLVWKDGATRVVCNLADEMQKSQTWVGSKTAFNVFSRFTDEHLWETALVFNSKFKLVSITQIEAEWNELTELKKAKDYRKKSALHRRRYILDGRRHCRKVRTTNERKKAFQYKDDESYFENEPSIRGKRRKLPSSRDDIHSGTKTKNWKYNRKTQYK
ncbi:hypothetical protein [Vibrio sp. D431a]|uniref:hypothetical protein n=1 Tax=Vibrio sp. D431a TaxID=2837388 RepID=UPI002556C4ED|nr:hypothetical protein [Vibrio sp. D431a]MDK9793860.1 hypothetical protein [Vibrio sp. D431a]